MDQRFATLESHQIPCEIPSEIHPYLFSIALHGHDVKHISYWYQSVLQTLRRMNTENAQPAGTGLAAANIVPDDSINAQYTEFLDTNCAARRSTMATIDSCISATANVHAIPSTEMPSMDSECNQAGPIYAVPAQDSTSQAYHTPQSYHTYTTTPQQIDSTPEPPHSQSFLTNWSPAPSSAAEADIYASAVTGSVSNGNLLAFTGEPANAPTHHPWFNAQDASGLHSRNLSQQSHLSQQSLPVTAQHIPHQPYLSPEYNTPLSGTAMPVLVPYASSAGSGNYTKAAAIPTGPGASLYQSGNGFFPIIHVSSSRRRRKALQKGVKKMVQPLKGRRQQSV